VIFFGDTNELHLFENIAVLKPSAYLNDTAYLGQVIRGTDKELQRSGFSTTPLQFWPGLAAPHT
jgi:hypothetical protein